MSFLASLHKNLLVIYAVYVKEMKIWLRYPTWILVIIALPYMLSGFFYVIGMALGGPVATRNFAEKTGTPNALLYYVVGSAMFLIAALVIDSIGRSIRQEQYRGTFEIHYSMPISRVVLWSSHILPQGTVMFVTLGISLIPALMLSGLPNPISAFIGVLILTISMIPLFGIGLIVAALTVRFKEPWAVTNILKAVISVVSGFYYPLYVLPAWLRVLAGYLPTTHAITLIRDLLIFNREFLASDPRVIALVVLSSIYFLTGLSVFKRWESRARKTGELSKY